ncbi:MAG: hypothetical protein KTR13_09700 [Saprospiraceae bacterium]|nr:hypothetical protein [Saprospiraceae bacterium]
MYKFIKEAHSGWAYLTLLALVIAVVYFLLKLVSKKGLGPGDKKFALAALITTHIQFLLGLILLFVSPQVKQAFSDFSATTSDENGLRLLALEHPVAMLIAVVFITIAYSKIKKAIASGNGITTSSFILLLLGFLAVLSRVPWSTWLG